MSPLSGRTGWHAQRRIRSSRFAHSAATQGRGRVGIWAACVMPTFIAVVLQMGRGRADFIADADYMVLKC
ncbi:hypothetical protein C1J02_17250 [Sulfitobacter sp. SK011]|nr:hypothetical protein C1J02_17250 [Sulfitobacter sp. SK011]